MLALARKNQAFQHLLQLP